MKEKLEESTISETDDPRTTLRDSSGRFGRSALLENYWAEFNIERYVAGLDHQRSDESNGAYRGQDRGTSLTVTKESAGESFVELPRPVKVDTAAILTFHPLQEWEGYVTAIDDETFSARLTDVTIGDQLETEDVELPISDLDDEDRRLLAPGRVFRWAIGYQRSRGSKRRVSQIVFRRLPQWTERDLSQAEEEAKALSAKMRWE